MDAQTMFPLLCAYRNNTLLTLIQNKAQEYLDRWPNYNETSAIVLSAAYYGKLAQKENETLTMDARRLSESIDDLWYWLKEDAPMNILGYIAEISGSRSLLIDMELYDQMITDLESRNWSYTAMEERIKTAQQDHMRDYFNGD